MGVRKRSAVASSEKYYIKSYCVSVTGLSTRNWLSTPSFLRLSRRACNEALKANGNVYSSTSYYNGIQYIITAWDSTDSMKEFFSGEVHANLMTRLKRVSSYAKVHEYFVAGLPSKGDAINELKKDGVRLYGEPKAKCGDLAPIECWHCSVLDQ